MKLLLVLTAALYAAASDGPLSLVEYGSISVVEDDGSSKNHREFRLAWGDTSRQDAAANAPGRDELGPFSMNAAHYFPAGDGRWNLFNFKLPSESLTDPAALEERQRFRDYLSRPDVRAALEAHAERADFGAEGDFIHKKMGLSADELPAPFNRLSPRTLSGIQHILRYNADGTMKVYLRQPLDREGPAQAYFQRLKAELGL